MEKYRIKLNTDRIIGPLELKDFVELVYKDAVDGSEEVQYFPIGEWAPMDQFPELIKILKSDIKNVDQKTFIENIDSLELTKSHLVNQEELQEFKFDHIDPLTGIILGEFTSKKVLKDQPARKNSEDDLDTTKIVSADILKSEDIDKTKINPDYQKYLEKLKKEEEEKQKKKAKKERSEKKEETIVDYENEATQFMSLEDMAPELEQALETEEAFVKKEIRQIKQEKLKEQKSEQKAVQDKSEEKARVKRLFILSVAALLFIFFILPDEKPKDKKELKPINLVGPDIVFPGRYDRPNKELANENYMKGLELLNSYTYVDTVKAAKHFRESVVNQFNDNPAMHRLIFSYARILDNSDTFIDDANSIFKLVLINKSKALNDPFFASAVSYFYYKVDKINAAISIFDKYMTIKNANPNTELFAVYLKALTKSGKFDLATKIYNRLNAVKNKNHFILESLYEYQKTLGQLEGQVAIIKEAKKLYPESAYFDIEAGLILADSNKLKDLQDIILKINANNAEGSKLYYSKYLTLKGLLFALNGKTDLAVKDFQESLNLYRNLDLVEKLSLLKRSGNKNTDTLISDSRAIKALRLAQRAYDKNELKQSFKYALEASNFAPNMIEVKIHLAKLQLRKGYIQDAINQLKELYEKNPSSIKLVFQLIDAYIEAYQFREASDLINATVNMPGGEIHDFYSAKAKFSLYKGNFNSAIGWLQRAINANPIDDNNIYNLAKLFIKAYKFLDAKKILKRAMDLDPSNIEYKILFAKILYEVETSSSAIGYLYDVLKDYPDNPSILAEIGIYYYRSGQIKRYKNIRDQLLELPKKSPSLYKFLVESARLDDDIEKMIEYQEKLVQIEPGLLDVRMKLANQYIKLERYKEAKNHLEAVSKRLKTYPRLNYSFARLYLLVDDLERSKEMAFKEIKENPTVDETYVLLGDIFKREENYQESNKYYVKAMQINPKNTDAILGVAYIAFRNEQHELALDQYQKVIEIDPNRLEVYKLLGDAYRKLGQSQLAIKFYKDFLTRSPESKYKTKIETYIRTMQ